MSFDIYGGIKALEVLKTFGSTHDQAEAVAEAIVRHQDVRATENLCIPCSSLTTFRWVSTELSPSLAS